MLILMLMLSITVSMHVCTLLLYSILYSILYCTLGFINVYISDHAHSITHSHPTSWPLVTGPTVLQPSRRCSCPPSLDVVMPIYPPYEASRCLEYTRPCVHSLFYSVPYCLNSATVRKRRSQLVLASLSDPNPPDPHVLPSHLFPLQSLPHSDSRRFHARHVHPAPAARWSNHPTIEPPLPPSWPLVGDQPKPQQQPNLPRDS